jgi:hypothetical protein
VITCPVCEHQQAAGADCEVCGRVLVLQEGAAGPPVAPLEGLEPTAAAGVTPTGAIESLPGLEATLQAPAGDVVPDPIPELEPTLAGSVEVVGDQVPDLEPTAAAASGDPRTELPLFPVCRYCRTPAGPGERLCGRCGIRLPLPPSAVPTAASAAPRYCSCGAPISRASCPSCGARNRVE